MDSLQVFRLYKSKAKLSSLLQHTVSIQPSFYVLAAGGASNSDEPLDTIWFNRWNGTQELKKSTRNKTLSEQLAELVGIPL